MGILDARHVPPRTIRQENDLSWKEELEDEAELLPGMAVHDNGVLLHSDPHNHLNAQARKCLQNDPRNALGHYLFAKAQWKAGNLAGALAAVQVGLTILPDENILVNLKTKLVQDANRQRNEQLQEERHLLKAKERHLREEYEKRLVEAKRRKEVRLRAQYEKRLDEAKQLQAQQLRAEYEKRLCMELRRAEQAREDELQRVDNKRRRRDENLLPSDGRFADMKVLKVSGQAVVLSGTMLQEHGSCRQRVAIKVFLNKNGWAECKNEIKMLLGLPRHPNVMEVLDFNEVPKPSFVMRFIPGGNPFDRLKQHGRFVGDEAVWLLKGIGEGLRHLHAHGIVHRDVKSPNIVLEECLQPVLIDLGLSKTMDHSEITGSRFLTAAAKGTLLWMSPEMMVPYHHEWSAASDMYALGIIMWEILTGREPYAGIKTDEIVRYVRDKDGRPDISGMTDVPQAHLQLMKDLWDKDPSKRPSAEEFLRLI